MGHTSLLEPITLNPFHHTQLQTPHCPRTQAGQNSAPNQPGYTFCTTPHNPSRGVPRQWSWRLNPTLLHNPAIRDSISRAITEYFSLNKQPVTSPGILWAAHKTVIRGTLISQAAHHKKKRLANLERNLKELRLLEIAFKKQPTPDLNTKIQQHQAAIKNFMSADTAKALQWTRQLFYEKSNKADSLLAPEDSHTDQLTVIFRYLEGNQPAEHFVIFFLPSTRHKGEEMADALLAFLNSVGLTIQECRGQSFDNASNISGHYKGMQRYKKLKDKLDEKVSMSMPKKLSDIRWSYRADACQALVHGYENIMDILFEFSTDIEYRTTRYNKSSKTLQSVQLNLNVAVGVLKSLKEAGKRITNAKEYIVEHRCQRPSAAT
ncbi:Hypothetical predicted protein [Pelobates cultripes]|uniref:Uncharacterized protein n=1 Tax=Pelobates cultripes TaxID=61616 RepID=A0AAD1S690_PELCU|nr:Hypothetical predicted protein [Pelobates cultripes]